MSNENEGEPISATDILRFLANENDEVDMIHATTVLSMAICSLAVQYGLSKERLMHGMGVTYDAYKVKFSRPEGESCH